ncbi:glycosyltransferase [Lascolabacillus sp.]|jgi:glycosyltransferase involved in cell wall biosynthesis|uniref:glycosyltransferase family 2 protein n=1 Tax=Lascolabacillus sp. TaxID=1924068 RepID=UPI0025899889|nr:glycosyltransferase [Lascolabacillus sp.]MDD2607333.1 glycosyltransferase [Lascolabacillus sp.]
MDQDREIDRPKVSVIMPVYNTAEFVGEALGSILNQSLKEIEIIVIDDGSTDDSVAVIRRLAASDERIHLHLQGNCGPSRSRNRGVEIANGEYLYFMDSDDLLEPDALGLCYRLASDRQLDFLFFDAVSFSSEGLETDETIYRRTYLFDELVTYTGVELVNRMVDYNLYRASVCLNFIDAGFLKRNSILFFPDIIHEDELFTARLYLSATRVACLKRDLYRRRIRSGSITTTRFSERNIEGYLTVVRELKQIYDENRELRATAERIISYVLNPAIYNSKGLLLRQRVDILIYCSRHRLLTYLKTRSIAVMLFPWLITIKKLFKRQ